MFLEECRDELLDRVIRHERRALERLVRRGRGPAARREPLFDRYTLIGMAVADAQDRVFHYFAGDAAAEIFRQLPNSQTGYLGPVFPQLFLENGLVPRDVIQNFFGLELLLSPRR